MKKEALLKLLVISILSGLFFFLPPIDTDLGWHLRYGEYFLKNLTPLRGNPLTYLLPNYNWQPSYLFYDAAAALIYQKNGLLGLSFANAFTFAVL